MPAPSPRSPSNLAGGEWLPIPPIAGRAVTSCNPARPSEEIWSGSPTVDHIDRAVAAARTALPAWSRWPLDKRAAVLRTLASLFTARADDIAALIRDEVGKPLWDAKGEASILANKVDITLEMCGLPKDPTAAPSHPSRVAPFDFPLSPSKSGACWFRPHGITAVIGPFNFPAHLPNGHVVPALAMGNTIVFKPSDKAPAVGQLLSSLYQEALDTHAAPPGTFNLVHGGADVASRLVSHPELDAILFTGSWPVGRRILEANLDHPGRLIALELGGSNPAVILPDADLKQAITECVRSAFVGAGQRCTCTRRLIVHEDIADRVIPALCKAASTLIVGDPRGPTAADLFMGPVISHAARRLALETQQALARAGGELLVPMEALSPDQTGGEQPTTDSQDSGHFLTAGVMRVDRFDAAPPLLTPGGVPAPGCTPGCDIEVFAPFLRICLVSSLDEAIEQANATQFGLAASIFTKDQAAIAEFCARARAGCINVNTGTAGASSKLPFGGLGLSGNHRPAGSFSVDYCAYPVAGMIEHGPAAQTHPGMKIEDAWLR
jgi:succinylglutamic semialdehyde dehydrogenase